METTNCHTLAIWWAQRSPHFTRSEYCSLIGPAFHLICISTSSHPGFSWAYTGQAGTLWTWTSVHKFYKDSESALKGLALVGFWSLWEPWSSSYSEKSRFWLTPHLIWYCTLNCFNMFKIANTKMTMHFYTLLSVYSVLTGRYDKHTIWSPHKVLRYISHKDQMMLNSCN